MSKFVIMKLSWEN